MKKIIILFCLFVSFLSNAQIIKQTNWNNTTTGGASINSTVTTVANTCTTTIGGLGSNYASIHLGTATESITGNNYFITSNGTNDCYVNAPNDSANLTLTKGNGVYFVQFRGAKTNADFTPSTEFRGGDRANITAGTENAMWWFNGTGVVRKWKAGTVALQRNTVFDSPNYMGATGNATITNAYTTWHGIPVASTSMTILNKWGIGTTGSAHITQSVVIGSAAKTPTATLDVTGTMSVSSTATVNGNFYCNSNVEASTVLGLGSLQGDLILPVNAGNLNIKTRNASSSDIVLFTTGTTSTETMRLTSAGVMSVTGSMYSSGSATLANVLINSNGINLTANGQGLIISAKTINVTSGDAATINAPVGRFRKDTSGATFTLTNSFITANSIILITFASDPGATPTHAKWVTAGAGSATINFDSAPSNDVDINFFIIN